MSDKCGFFGEGRGKVGGGAPIISSEFHYQPTVAAFALFHSPDEVKKIDCYDRQECFWGKKTQVLITQQSFRKKFKNLSLHDPYIRGDDFECLLPFLQRLFS